MEFPTNLTEEQQKLADALTPRELAFANLVLTMDQHGMRRPTCYEMAGFSAKNKNVAYVEGGRLLKKPKVHNYCQAMRAKSMQEVGLTLNYLDQQLKDIIDGTTVEIVTTIAQESKQFDSETGEPIVNHIPVIRCSFDELPPEVQGSIQSVKRTQHGFEVKQYSRLEALRMAYQRVGALREGRELTGPGGTPLEAPMLQYQIVGGPGQEPPLQENDMDFEE